MATIIGTILGIWAFRVIGITASIYGAIELFGQHRIVSGILVLIFLSSIIGWVAGWIIKVIQFITLLIWSVIETVMNSKKAT